MFKIRKFQDKQKNKKYSQVGYEHFCSSNNTLYFASMDMNIWWKPRKFNCEGLVKETDIRYCAASYGWLFFQFTISKFIKNE